MSLDRVADGNDEKFVIELKAGLSGDPTLEYRWLQTAIMVFELFCRKQNDYGHGNIAKLGEVGVMVRANDKLERLRTLLTTSAEPANESLVDTWQDLAGYGIIGLMCHQGDWPEYAPALWDQLKQFLQLQENE